MLIEKSYALRDPSFHGAVVVAKAEVDRVQDWHVKCVLGNVRLQLAAKVTSTDNRGGLVFNPTFAVGARAIGINAH